MFASASTVSGRDVGCLPSGVLKEDGTNNMKSR